ncbi:MAG: hypothetical protein IPM29_00690 [Planctomycetes bacterium]|nr:hypothetical protein [Planctomycetota bacterium]
MRSLVPCRLDRTRAGVLAVVLLAAVAPAQRAGSPTVVPAEFAATEAPGLAFWPAAPFPMHHQLVLDANWLASQVHGPIDGIRVRRNADPGGDDAVGGRVHLALEVGLAATSAAAASPVFADNMAGTPELTLQLTLDLPARPSPTIAPASWAEPDAVLLPFPSPVRVRGAGLCLDLRTRPAVDPGTGVPLAPYWPVDAWIRPPEQPLEPLGGGCGIGALDVTTTGVEGLALAGTATFQLATQRTDGLATLALGLDLPVPGGEQRIELGALGAPGCTLHLWPLALLPAPLTALPRTPSRGLALIEERIPNLPAFASVGLRSQWIIPDPGANALGAALSPAHRARIGTATPPGHAWIMADGDADATHGVVWTDRIPVLAFD